MLAPHYVTTLVSAVWYKLNVHIYLNRRVAGGKFNIIL